MLPIMNFLDDFNIHEIATTRNSIQDMEEELTKLTAEENLLRQQLAVHMKENQDAEHNIEENRKEKEQVLEKTKALKRAWNEMGQNLRTEKSACVGKTKRLCTLLGISFKVQQTSDLVWDIKISADGQRDENYLILKYFKEIDKFELVTMNPAHPNIKHIKEYFATNNDVVGLLCTIRSYFKLCTKEQQFQVKPNYTVAKKTVSNEEK